MELNNNIAVVLKQPLYFKKKVCFIMLVFFSISFAFSQKYATSKFEYIIKNNESFYARQVLESGKSKNLSEKMKNTAMKMMMVPGYFVLYFNSDEAIYRQKDTIEKMEIESDRIELPSFLKLFAGGESTYYTNSPDEQILLEENSIVLEKRYLISYNFSEWELLNETKKIGDYICYKATKKNEKLRLDKNKQIIVWYSPEIPVRFGPKLYNGLPGLALEVNKGPIIIRATKVELNLKEKFLLEKPKKGIKITSEDYTKKIIKASEANGLKL